MYGLLVLLGSFLVACTIGTLSAESNDITHKVFGSVTDGIPSAFGDFNSDELTDLFVLRNNGKTVQILFGSETEPLLMEGPKCEFEHLTITSVVPGDFDGDAFMDVLITVTQDDPDVLGVYVNWGAVDRLNCTSESKPPLLRMRGEPVALDYNRDMVIDLFGLSEDGNRTFWIFTKDRLPPRISRMENKAELSIPHSHAYLNLDADFTADLFVTSKTSYEVWNGVADGEDFKYSHRIEKPVGNGDMRLGQSVFVDFELRGHINQIVPICFDRKCLNSTIQIHAGNHFHDLRIDFKNPSDQQQWGFVVPDSKHSFTNTITLRPGDYNMDGYPDLIATLQRNGQTQTFLLENVACERNCDLSRTFAVQWHALAPFSNGTVLGVFYDFYQDGILDVIMLEKSSSGNNNYRPVAFRNTLDYDANFVKVIVLTGLTNDKEPLKSTPLGRKKRTYGTNLPGPRIEYTTTTQDGYLQQGTSVQLPQSAYFALHLPYTIFGLGRTPNFVDSLTVGLSNRSRTWRQLIPNSQMVVIPWPIDSPTAWKAQLFVTPSKLILMSMIALGGTCLFIMFIILALYIKEKREDKIEKLQEAHRFHFDAM